MKNNRMLAPILLFVFARPDHTEKTLLALAENELASLSDLIIYSDAARNDEEERSVNQVRNLIKKVGGFRSVTVVERQTNYGLARNIIEGVTDVCNRYGRAIVLEDDLVTSPQFLSFMNAALDRYEEDKRVWHISGWNYPIDPSGLGDAFFLRVMNCWGWATWADRWQNFEKDTERLMSYFDKKRIREFDLQGSGYFWCQILGNVNGLINTWAIYWYATIFMKSGLCLNPGVSYVENIGLDGSGTHGCRDKKKYVATLNKNADFIFPKLIQEHPVGLKRVVAFYRDMRPGLIRRAVNKFFSLVGVVRD